MNRLALVVVAFLVLAVLVVGLALPRVSEQAFTYASRPQPMSPAQLVLESRQIAPAVPDGGSGLVVWLLLSLISVGATVLVLRHGSEALRQWRLLRGRNAHHRSPYPIPTLPTHEYPALPTVRPIPSVPQQLPGGNQHES